MPYYCVERSISPVKEEYGLLVEVDDSLNALVGLSRACFILRTDGGLLNNLVSYVFLLIRV